MFYKIVGIDQQPSVRLSNWKIMRMKEGEFFAGQSEWDPGRVSTKIVEFDEEKKLGRTASGRVYELVGEEAATLGIDASYVWEMYKRVNHLTELDPV